MSLAAIIAGGASLAGGILRNQAQVGSAREQMAFQERMSNTAHQRQIKDLREAGLNPILSARYGGSSSPGGAMPQIQDVITPAVNTGLQTLTQTTQAKKVTQETKKLAEETMSASVDAWVKNATKDQAVVIKWQESFQALINTDLKNLDYKQQKLYINTMLAELEVKSREANLAASDLGIMMRNIREVSESVGIKGSDFLNLIPTALIGKLKGLLPAKKGMSVGPNLFKGKPS